MGHPVEINGIPLPAGGGAVQINNPYHASYTKIDLKWSIDLNVNTRYH